MSGGTRGGSRAPRTHLVIHHGDGEPPAQLFAWDADTGPRPFPVEPAA